MESSSAPASTPAKSVTAATSVTPAASVTPATSVVPSASAPPVLDPDIPTSRRFPLMGAGVGAAPVVDPSDPQVIAAKASNDGTATHDFAKAYAVVAPPDAPSTK